MDRTCGDGRAGRQRRQVAPLLAALALVAGVGSAHAGEGPRCRAVRARIVTTFVACEPGFDSPVGLCTVGRVTGERRLEGTTRFRALSAAPSAGMPDVESAATLAYAGELELTTRDGVLLLSDVGLLDPQAATFTELERILSGRGDFEGATGSLVVSGAVTPTGFDGTLSGQLCLRR